jgi:hypothetical protein
LLFSQINETPTTIIGLVIVLASGMGGLLGWLIRHLFVVTLPAMQATFTEEMRWERETCAKQFEASLMRIDKALDLISSHQEEYRRNQEEWRLRWQATHGDT